jgi:hypothetical protein
MTGNDSSPTPVMDAIDDEERASTVANTSASEADDMQEPVLDPDHEPEVPRSDSDADDDAPKGYSHKKKVAVGLHQMRYQEVLTEVHWHRKQQRQRRRGEP